MKRRILIGVFLATMVASLAGCGTSKETKTTSGNDVKIEQSNDKSKKLLEDASFTLSSFYGLSYYAPPKESYQSSRETTRDKEKAKYPAFGEAGSTYVDRRYEFQLDDVNDILSVYYFDTINDIKVSRGTTDLILSNLEYYLNNDYDKSKLTETDSMFIYEDNNSFISDDGYPDFCCVFIMVKDTYDIYKISCRIPTDRKLGKDGLKRFNERGLKNCWTEETWNAFVDTLNYVK